MSILQVISSRERDLGGFVVRRILPFEGQLGLLETGAVVAIAARSKARVMLLGGNPLPNA